MILHIQTHSTDCVMMTVTEHRIWHIKGGVQHCQRRFFFQFVNYVIHSFYCGIILYWEVVFIQTFRLLLLSDVVVYTDLRQRMFK